MFQDWKANRGNIKGRMIMVFFRFAFSIRRLPFPLWVICSPILILYRVCVEWLLGVELPFKTRVGRGMIIQHGQGLVVNDGTIIGENCTLRNNCTIGIKKDQNGVKSKAPVLGNNVDVGANSVIIGPVVLGNNVVVGAGSVVVTDIPSDSIVVGNPARVIKTISK